MNAVAPLPFIDLPMPTKFLKVWSGQRLATIGFDPDAQPATRRKPAKKKGAKAA